MAVVLVLAMLAHFGAHFAIVGGLATHHPRWHAGVALLVPPLGVWWAQREGMSVRVWTWAASLVVYIVALVIVRV